MTAFASVVIVTMTISMATMIDTMPVTLVTVFVKATVFVRVTRMIARVVMITVVLALWLRASSLGQTRTASSGSLIVGAGSRLPWLLGFLQLCKPTKL